MKKILCILFLIIAVIVFAFLFFSYADVLLAPVKKNTEGRVCYKNYCFEVELAKTEREREQGLMFRNTLKEDEGMLFIFDKDEVHLFWMKNTLIPLDIIWIDKNYNVVFISKNSQPCKLKNICPAINPGVFSRYVLEINAGLADAIGLESGERVNIAP